MKTLPWLAMFCLAACVARTVPDSSGGALGQNGAPGTAEEGEAEAEGECGECISDEECNGGTCSTAAGSCLPSCDCMVCDVCAGHCNEGSGGCGDGMCDGDATNGIGGESCRTCPADCGPCEPEPACGDGVCNGPRRDGTAGETCDTCPEDCGRCPGPVCGDGICDGDAANRAGGENCRTCQADCGPCDDRPWCGDGVCDGPRMDGTAGESCDTCPQDCGRCGCAPPPGCGEICGDGLDNDCNGIVDEGCGEACGNGVCDHDMTTNRGETCETCARDCGPCPPTSVCGDGMCDGNAMGDMLGETCDTCPADCGDCGCVPSPDGAELCGDMLDNDCDGLIDEGCDPAGDSCGNGVCDGDNAAGLAESCETCPVDCGPCPGGLCGDGMCDGNAMGGMLGETCDTCPADCGNCGCVPSSDGAELCGDMLDNDCDDLIDEGCDPAGDSCGNGVCDQDATTGMGETCETCPVDCGPCPGGVCGDGVCDGNAMGGMLGETCDTCPADCGNCGSGCSGLGGLPCPPGQVCVDDPADDCDPNAGADCPGVCVPSDGICGDGICDLDAATGMGESCETCPADCGDCPRDCVPPPGCGEVCGDRLDNDCDGLVDEDCAPCGVCGDGICDGHNMNGTAGETCETCPADCGECPGDCVCPTQWNPVCGEDGMTYPNQCEAECAGVRPACQGECPCP